VALAAAGERQATFRALADPTRRALLDLLAGGERSVMELVGQFQVSQPAISQHLGLLREAGLVRERRSGRQRLYRLQAAPLADVYDWVGHYRRFWDDRLQALGDHLDETAPEESRP
jgi:DNA-binding transcriptional ArsR family regulator